MRHSTAVWRSETKKGKKKKKPTTKPPVSAVDNLNSSSLGSSGSQWSEHTHLRLIPPKGLGSRSIYTQILVIYWLSNTPRGALISWPFRPAPWIARGLWRTEKTFEPVC